MEVSLGILDPHLLRPTKSDSIRFAQDAAWMSILRQLSRKLKGPRCHVTPEEKLWVERRMIWLKDQFGSQPIRRAPLEPTPEFLPTRWDSSYDAGADLFNRLCKFMLLDPSEINVHFYSSTEDHKKDSHYAGHHRTSGAAGFYVGAKPQQKTAIALAEEGLFHPAQLAATILHELAHIHLLGDDRIKREEEDCEPLTDLLTVYFGAGILTANSAFRFSQWQDGNRGGWQASTLGYLSEPLYGYALASFSWLRGDREPKWQKRLRQNIEYYFSDSMHFLITTSDTTLPFNGA